MTKSLYHTEVINDKGVNGTVYVKGGESLLTSDPLKDSPGFNPEQLFGLSWATCLNATLEALLGVPSAYEEFVSIRNRFKNFAVILYI